jgi:hypothetical protein
MDESYESPVELSGIIFVRRHPRNYVHHDRFAIGAALYCGDRAFATLGCWASPNARRNEKERIMKCTDLLIQV